MKKSVCGLVLLVFLATGCASYTPSLVITPAEQYGVVGKTEVGLVVKGDPYFNVNRQKEILDENFSQYGFLPIYISIENNTQAEYAVSDDGVELIGVTGVGELSTADIMAKAEKSAFGRALGVSLIVPIISIPIAAAATADSVSKANKAMEGFLEVNSFKPGTIKPNCVLKGFLFFNIKDLRDISAIGIRVTAINNNTKQPEAVELYFNEQLKRDQLINLSCKSKVPPCLKPPRKISEGTGYQASEEQIEATQERKQMMSGRRRR